MKNCFKDVVGIFLAVKETKGKGGSKENVGKKRSGSGKSPEGRTSVSPLP